MYRVTIYGVTILSKFGPINRAKTGWDNIDRDKTGQYDIVGNNINADGMH
jgi:hypothetical protein